MEPYTLTPAEIETLRRFTDQADKTTKEIAATENRLNQLRANLNAQQGAFTGAVQLILSQQGVVPAPNQQVKYDAEANTLSLD